MAKEYAQTKSIKDAVKLAKQLVQAEDAAIGEVIGETGTGKSAAGLHLAQTIEQSWRICCYDGMGHDKLMRAIFKAVFGNAKGVADWENLLKEMAGDGPARPLLVVDECNSITWRILERLRYLADECGWAVLLVGTELYTNQFADARTKPLLKQLGRRIGAKRVKLKHLDRAETLKYILKPRFGEVDKEVLTKFWGGCRKGNWGEAVELANACKRVMDANNKTLLGMDVLNAAMADQANAPAEDGTGGE